MKLDLAARLALVRCLGGLCFRESKDPARQAGNVKAKATKKEKLKLEPQQAQLAKGLHVSSMVSRTQKMSLAANAEAITARLEAFLVKTTLKAKENDVCNS